MSAARVVGGLLLSCAGTVACAGIPDHSMFYNRWFVLPEQPTTRTEVLVRNMVTGCDSASPARAITVNGATIDVFLEPGSDLACHDPLYVDHYQDTRAGYLPAGAYTVRFFYCDTLADFENPPCTLTNREYLHFTVAEAGRARQTIPTLSAAGAFAATLLLAGIAFFRLRPR